MRNDIDRMVQRTQQYWYVDGLAEIAGGLVIFLIGLLFLSAGVIQDQHTTSIVLAVGQPAVVLFGIFGARRLVRYFKERITYPRTGYVTYQRPKGRRRWLVMLAAAAVSISLVVTLQAYGERLQENFLPALSGFFIALLIGSMAYQNGLMRFWIMAFVCFAVGLSVAVLSVPDWLRNVYFFGLLGLSWMISGTLALISYLRNTNRAGEDE
jgi:hypothetical protein